MEKACKYKFFGIHIFYHTSLDNIQKSKIKVGFPDKNIKIKDQYFKKISGKNKECFKGKNNDEIFFENLIYKDKDNEWVYLDSLSDLALIIDSTLVGGLVKMPSER